MPPLPLIAPDPPRLSELGDGLRRVEASGTFSNNGPELRAFEAEAQGALFGGVGACLGVANATLGLMIAIRDAAGARAGPGALALMPALTFAATAQAAQWAGLRPLICDVDPDRWSACPAHEERLLQRYGDRVAAVVPYATFGDAIDLDRYRWIQRRFGVSVVVDAASSLGTLDAGGRGFGAGAPFAIVHSMHATKTFAVAEGGLIHSGDLSLIERLRHMANFGFERARHATMPGLNAKLPEVLALMAREKLRGFDAVCAGRAAVEAAYARALDGVALQATAGRPARQFMPVALPRASSGRRDAIVAAMAREGIGVGCYFSPHLGEQDWFRDTALIEPTPVADDLSARLLSLPITDAMTPADAVRVAAALKRACRAARPARARATPAVASAVIVGGGPAGAAVLTAAAKAGRLDELARGGLVLVERGRRIGEGRLPGYAITSDSTARTFLSAVEGTSLADHPSALAVAAHADALGVPLAELGPFLQASGEALVARVAANGGAVLRGREVRSATRTADGLWRVTIAGPGRTEERLARALVVATGGHQPPERIAAQPVAGAPLAALAGDRLVPSDEALSTEGFQSVLARLAEKRSPRVAVVGGSTSALAAVALLLKSGLPWGAGGVSLLHRRPLRPFYPSEEAARADGYDDFDERDVCPVSGFVYRLGGFRLEARELVLRTLGVGGRSPDPRLAVVRIGTDEARARRRIEEADLVVGALGYRPRALPLFDADGAPLALSAHGEGPMVDQHCRLIDADGRALPDAYGIGLAAGFVPWGPLGGEPSFRGQANGLWLWQNDVGRMIVDQLLGAGERAAA